MFKRSFSSKDRAGKSVKPMKKIYREQAKVKMQERLDSPPVGRSVNSILLFLSSLLPELTLVITQSTLTSPIVTMVVGRDQRLFAAHEDVLSNSPFFSTALKDQMLDGSAKQLALPDEYAFLSRYLPVA
jgi:hypothetical protein